MPVLYDTMTEVLSNNGSEWIESALAGKLSWEEFRAPQTPSGIMKLKRMESRVKIFAEALRIEGAKARGECMKDWREPGSLESEKGLLGILQEDVEPVSNYMKELAAMLKVRVEGKSVDEDGKGNTRKEGEMSNMA
jgi:hypothetical protein